MAKCNWEPFYEEFAHKLLEYKEDRNSLLNKLNEVYDNTEYAKDHKPTLGKSEHNNEGRVDLKLGDKLIPDIDPFTVLNCLNSKFSPNPKKEYDKIVMFYCSQQIKTIFNMTNEFPNNYDGIGLPTANPQRRCFIWFEEGGNSDQYSKNIEYAWSLFEAIVQYGDDQSSDNRDKLSDIFNDYSSHFDDNFSSPYISIRLFWIAPNFFVPLDSNSQQFISGVRSGYSFSSETGEKLQSLIDNFNCDEYLDFCDSLRSDINKSGKSISDICYDSYSPNRSKSDNTKRQESNEIENVIMGYLQNNGYPKFVRNSSSTTIANTTYAKYPTNDPGAYFMTIDPIRLTVDWYIILNDTNKSIIYLFKIPKNTFYKDSLKHYDSDANKGLLEIHIKYDDMNFCDKNIASFSLKEYWIETIEYSYAKNQGIKIEKRELHGKNIIYYGIPGCGKTYLLNKKLADNSIPESNIIRLTLHPDYSYADFVGQILPVPLEKDPKKLEYKFVPGPFTNILTNAIKNPLKRYFLIIDEVNRGNAPAIFGDIFQLLDRDENGRSKYSINNNDIITYETRILVKGELNPFKDGVYIPSNLFILCTMNTSDQNVYPLDTAFQRRWTMKFVPDKIEESNLVDLHIGNDEDTITWGDFQKAINKEIKKSNGIMTTEDKSLGAYFCKEEEIINIELFANKVLKYLWDDALKLNRESIFDLSNVDSFQEIYNIIIENEGEPEGSLLSGVLKDDFANKR